MFIYIFFQIFSPNKKFFVFSQKKHVKIAILIII